MTIRSDTGQRNCSLEIEKHPSIQEPVEDYALRIQTLEQKLIRIYEALGDLDQQEKIINKKRIKQKALECFIFGLRDPPESRV